MKVSIKDMGWVVPKLEHMEVSIKDMDWVVPKLEHLDNKLTEFAGNNNEFEKALARFDEIILTKSSKEDTALLRTELANSLKSEDFEDSLAKIQSRLCALENYRVSLQERISDILEDLEQSACSNKFRRRVFQDIVHTRASLDDLKHLVGTKASLEEFYRTSESMALKSDLKNLQAAHEELYKEFQKSLLYQTEVIRTLVRSNEPFERKNRRREDLLRTITGLLNAHAGSAYRTPMRSLQDSPRASAQLRRHIPREGSLEYSGKTTHCEQDVEQLRIRYRSNRRTRTREGRRLNVFSSEIAR